jgi:hypothetical protein
MQAIDLLTAASFPTIENLLQLSCHLLLPLIATPAPPNASPADSLPLIHAQVESIVYSKVVVKFPK